MRLVNIDQQIIVPICDETKGGVEYEMQMSIGEMFDKFLGGFQPEIVDAVSVEFIAKKLERSFFTDSWEAWADWIHSAMDEQKQEANHETD